MISFSRVLALSLGAFMWMALPASAVEVMVVGNAAPDAGLSQETVVKKLKGLMTKLYSYEGVNPIVYAANLSRAALEPRLREFEEKMAGADFVIFYYLGLGVRDASGASFLVPFGWNGNGINSELVPVKGILEKMRTAANGKSLFIVDGVDPDPAREWKHEGFKPGLGDIERETKAGGVLIAYNHEPLAGKDGTLFNASLEKRVSGPLQLKQLASLVQEDVSFETSGTKVPRLTGVISVSLQLKQASPDESAEKKKQLCTAANEQAEAKVRLASNGSGVASSEPAETAAAIVIGEKASKTSSAATWFFCPFDTDDNEDDVRTPRPHAKPRRELPPPAAGREPRRQAPPPRQVYDRSGGGGGNRADVRAAVPGG